ncbi:MAG: LysM peptidoglycan-binding domain-containing protein [Anaerolineales bacterium]|nr:LysM peptidoglycan-binding domain-containing protein [Chloroflexota bacterium]MBL6983768.1 LysM peptidoglycan-binding domain-containing protein [Anaerolineales bacterium]
MLRNPRIRYKTIAQISLLLLWFLSAPVYQAKEKTKQESPAGAVSRSELILAMNTLRVSQGLPALIEDPIVNAVAQVTAETMAANNMSWHMGDVRGRIAAAGYGGGATVWATENFAVGNMSIDRIMQVWADPDHMRPAVNPAYCHVGAGVAQAPDGRYYYILQAAYISEHACGEYYSGVDESGSGTNINPPVSQIIIPVKIATPDEDGRIYHLVQSGQSFWSIAIAYQITIDDLEVWNNLSRENGLIIGQKLFIPSTSTEGYATPTPVGMVMLATPDAEGKIVHEVQPYQVLIKIANTYQITVDTILALNGLRADWPLQIGQKLLIDPGNVTLTPTPRPLSAIEKLTPASDGYYYHTVQSGEFLAWIADQYDVNLADLMAWNSLTDDSIIYAGQQLLLLVTPPATATPTPAPPSTTPTITQTQVTPTHIEEFDNRTPSVTPSTTLESNNNSNSMAPLLVGVSMVLVVVLLGWAARRRLW